MKARSPIVGYNHNIRYCGRLYHVQTEDSGLHNPHLFTHLFHEGTILASKRFDYDPSLDDASVQRFMQSQHKSMLKELRAGSFDGKIEQFFGEPVLHDGDEAAPGTTATLEALPARVDPSTGEETTLVSLPPSLPPPPSMGPRQPSSSLPPSLPPLPSSPPSLSPSPGLDDLAIDVALTDALAVEPPRAVLPPATPLLDADEDAELRAALAPLPDPEPFPEAPAPRSSFDLPSPYVSKSPSGPSSRPAYASKHPSGSNLRPRATATGENPSPSGARYRRPSGKHQIIDPQQTPSSSFSTAHVVGGAPQYRRPVTGGHDMPAGANPYALTTPPPGPAPLAGTRPPPGPAPLAGTRPPPSLPRIAVVTVPTVQEPALEDAIDEALSDEARPDRSLDDAILAYLAEEPAKK